MVSSRIILINSTISESRGSPALGGEGLEKEREIFPKEGEKAGLWASLLKANLLKLTL